MNNKLPQQQQEQEHQYHMQYQELEHYFYLLQLHPKLPLRILNIF